MIGDSIIDRIDRKLSKSQLPESVDRIQERNSFLEFIHTEFSVDFQKIHNTSGLNYSQIMLRTGQNDILSLVKGDRLKLNKLAKYFNDTLSTDVQRYDISNVIKELIHLTISSSNVGQNLIDQFVIILDISIYFKELNSKPIDKLSVRQALKSILSKSGFNNSQFHIIQMMIDRIVCLSHRSELKQLISIIYIQNIRHRRSGNEPFLTANAEFLEKFSCQENELFEILGIFKECMGFNPSTYDPFLSTSIFKITHKYLTIALEKNQDKSFQSLVNLGYSKIGLFLFYIELSNLCQTQNIPKERLSLFHLNLNKFLRLKPDSDLQSLSIYYNITLSKFQKIARECILQNPDDRNTSKQIFLGKLKMFFKNISMYGGGLFDLFVDLEKVNEDIKSIQNDQFGDFDKRNIEYEHHLNFHLNTHKLVKTFMEFIYDNNFIQVKKNKNQPLM